VSTLAPTSSSSHNPDSKPHTSLYLKLLHAYLKEFVPSDCAPPRGGCGTLLHQNSRAAAESFRRAEFFVHTLVQFWLVGNDFSPLPVRTSRVYGLPLLSLLSRANVTLSERLPPPGLGDAVKLLVMYLNSSSGFPDARNVFDAMLSRKKPRDSPAGYWNPLLQRPLYRFTLRTFLFCPMGADIENVAQAFSAWMVYMEPWKVQQGDFNEYDLPPPGGPNVHCVGDGKRLKCDAEYSPAWQGYVLSNYLFYSSLVVHFLRFAHKFIHSDVASVLQMVSKVSRDLLHHIFQKQLAFCTVESYP
jgi:sphingomyelin phosphodiesterase 4